MTRSARKITARRAVWASVLLAAVGCHHKGPVKDPDTLIGRAQRTSTKKVTPEVDARLPPPLRSYVLATVPDKSVGPFLARGPGVAMAAYLGPGDGGTRHIVSVPMGPDGAPKTAHVLAPTLADSTTLVLRPAGGDHGAFVAGWTELTDRGEALSVAGVGADGGPMIPPIELARTTDDIVWVDFAPTARGEICVWAEETKANDANILAVPLDPNGKPTGVPSRVAKGVTAWQVVPTLAGAGLALVSASAPRPATGAASPPRAAEGSGGSSIAWLKLDPEARPVGPATPIATSPARVTDVDLARVHDSVVFAWTDRSEPDPVVVLASVDGEGKLTPPRAVTAHSGGAKLAAIGGGKSSGLLVWEEARRRSRPERRLHAARLDAAGAPLGPARWGVGEGTVLEVDAAGVPEVAALDDGFAVLVRARTCGDPPLPNETPCAEAPPVPVVLRLDASLHVTETEPVRIDEGQEFATLAWGLSCEDQSCLVLAAGQESPAKVRTIQLTQMPNRWHAPVSPASAANAPHVLAVDSIQAGDLFADVAVTPVDLGTLVATLTASAEEAPQGGPPKSAAVSLRTLDANGLPNGPLQTLTRRALAVGGIGIAAAQTAGSGAGAAPVADGAAVVWVAREGGRAQAHVTRVDKAGRRMKDVQLTTSSGDVTEAAIAWAGGGWIVSWIDTRDGNGEVYATKVDKDLNRVAREVRLTNAPGDASDIVLLGGPSGGDVWAAWADPRESPRDGFADIFAAKLSATSAQPVVPEARVLATAAHSRSPALAWGDAGRVDIGWIEEAPMSAGSDNSGAYGALLGTLDEHAKLVGDVVKTHGAGDGFPTSLALERTASGVLRVVMARAARDDLSLDVMELAKDKETQPSLLFMLDGPPSLDVSLTLLGGAVFFNDEGAEPGDGRARRIQVGWGR